MEIEGAKTEHKEMDNFGRREAQEFFLRAEKVRGYYSDTEMARENDGT
jgi:hypothetical protein